MTTDVLVLPASERRAGLRLGDGGFSWLMITPALALMLVLYAYPITQVLTISVTEPKLGLGNYAEIFESASIQRVLLTTARICLTPTALAVCLGYVIAYAMTAGSAAVQRWTLIAVVLPMWISALVRAFAWVVLLRRDGIVNSVLTGFGVTHRPLDLVWNEIGVVIGMTHYMLPYAILPLYANMRDIDPRW